MKFKTINPATEETIAEYETQPKDEVLNYAEKCNEAFVEWKALDITIRAKYFHELKDVLNKNKEKYAKLATLEMGKPIKQAIAEIEKCAWTSEVYAQNCAKWLEEDHAFADGKKHYVRFDPLGTILGIMPWNFPFWQAFRFAIPAMLAGNTAILKHSNVVPQCALAIEDAFKEAGFPENTFKALIADHESVSELVKFQAIHGVSLTGSVSAGAKIAELAGKNLKKVVLELGGSDPFVILEDADVELAAKNAVAGRILNSGQSCISAKRFIVDVNIAGQFIESFSEKMEKLIVGDPINMETEVGPLVRREQLIQIEEQVNDAVKKGAKVKVGGKKIDGNGYFFLPTVLTNTNESMKVENEEIFGPVAPVIIVKDFDAAIKTANHKEFGLGACIWTKDDQKVQKFISSIEAGCVFVNSIVKSDPRMPFGGIKKSGIGRELSKYGLREFTNVKSVNIYEHS